MPLYLHPLAPLPQVQEVYYSGLRPEVSASFSLGGWGWHHEAGVHVLRLILSGAFEEFPNLQVISGHWGEMVPFYLQRLDDMLPTNVTGLSTTITDTYRNHLWVTPSGMFYEPHFAFIRSVRVSTDSSGQSTTPTSASTAPGSSWTTSPSPKMRRTSSRTATPSDSSDWEPLNQLNSLAAEGLTCYLTTSR
jgi:hypothetical protein